MTSVYDPLIAGWLSGITEVTLTHPVDVLKTRMQIDKTDIKTTINKIYQERSFYQGYKYRLIGIGPMRMTFWGSMKIIDSQLEPYNLKKIYKLTLVGVGGSVCQTIIDSPIELLKTRMIGQQINKPSIRSVYRGFVPTVIRNAGFAAILQNGIYYSKKSIDSQYTIINNILIPGFAGSVGSVLTQPIDNVKTVYQKSTSKSLSDSVQEVMKNNIMRGTVPRATMGFLNMSVGYFAFNFFYNLLKN